jgi:hypothetical protein
LSVFVHSHEMPQTAIAQNFVTGLRYVLIVFKYDSVRSSAVPRSASILSILVTECNLIDWLLV